MAPCLLAIADGLASWTEVTTSMSMRHLDDLLEFSGALARLREMK